MADVKAIHISEFLEWSRSKNKYVFVGDIKKAIRFLRRINSKYAKINLSTKKFFPATYAMVERDLVEWFELVERPNVKIVRPAKKNRKLYAELSQQKGKWKVFAVPLENPDAKIRIITKNGKRVILEKTAIASYTNVYFNKKAFEVDPIEEVDRVLKPFKDIEHVRIMADKYLVGAKYESVKQVKREIDKFIGKYVNAGLWLVGLRVAHFNQPRSVVKRKKGKQNVKKGKNNRRH